MSFTREQIEQAEQYMLSTNPIIQQDAVNLIERWKKCNDSYILAFKILTESNHIYSQFYSITIIKEIVSRRWYQLPEDFQNSLKNYLTTKLTDFYSEKHLFKGVCEIISLIGIFDWPDRWPDFLDLFLGMKIIPKIKLYLLDSFTSIMFKGIYIKNSKRKKLFDVILSKTPDIYKTIFTGLSNEESVSIAFSVLNTQLKTLALDYYLQNDIIDNLMIFSSKPDLHIMSIQCLTTIFIEQYEISKLCPFIPKLLHLFISQGFSESSSLLYLSLKVMLKYSSFFCYLMSGMLSEIDIDGEFREVHIDNLESVQDNFLLCLEMILSCYLDEKQIDIFWELWEYLLPHLFTEPISNLPIYNKIKKLIPLIWESFYILLPTTIIEHEMIDSIAKKCWNIATYLFPSECIDILKKNPPSISLCYAIGYTEMILSSDVLNSILKIQLKNLIEHFYITDEQDYKAAINYTLSHCCDLLFCDANYVDVFFEIVYNCLENEEETVQVEAIKSLIYVAQKNTEIFFINDFKKTKELFTKIPIIITLDIEESLIIEYLKICTFLGYQSNNQELYELMITSIDEDFHKIVNNILDFKENIPENTDLILLLIPKIVQYIPQTILSKFVTSLFMIIDMENIGKRIGYEKMELIVKSLVSIISATTNSDVLTFLSKIYEILSRNETYLSLLFDSISIVCNNHTDLYPIYKIIENNFIYNILNWNAGIEDYISLYRLISNFPFNAISNLNVIMDIIKFGITHELSIIIDAAGNYCLNFLKKVEYNQDILCKITSSLIPPIIFSITDSKNNTCIFILISLLYELLTKFKTYDPTYSYAVNEILRCLQLNFDEIEHNFLVPLVQKAIFSIQNERLFHIAIFDLLRMLRVVISTDFLIFDEIGHPSIWISEEINNILNKITFDIEIQQEQENHQS